MLNNKLQLLRAEAILNTYRLMDGTDGSQVSTFSLARDLITDLMHYIAETKAGLPEDLSECALDVFQEEVQEEFNV